MHGLGSDMSVCMQERAIEGTAGVRQVEEGTWRQDVTTDARCEMISMLPQVRELQS